MSLTLSEKEAVVKEVAAEVMKAKTMVLAEYRGITVSDITRLRNRARAQKVYLRVIKNSLARRAVEGTQFASISDQMQGPLLYSLSEDAIAVAKVLYEFAKSNDKLVIRAGSYEGKTLDAAGVNTLAMIPGREQLLAQLVSMMQVPVSAFARGLAALAAKREVAT